MQKKREYPLGKVFADSARERQRGKVYDALAASRKEVMNAVQRDDVLLILGMAGVFNAITRHIEEAIGPDTRMKENDA